MHIASASRSIIMAALEELEDFVREKVEMEKWSYPKLSAYLQQCNPGTRGFSVRSLERFCAARDIHRTPRMCSQDVDTVVSAAIAKVSKF